MLPGVVGPLAFGALGLNPVFTLEDVSVSVRAVSKETPEIKGSKQLSVLIILGGAMRPNPILLRFGMHPGMRCGERYGEINCVTCRQA